MKIEHERAEEAARQREVEKYREQIRYQQELERQLEEREEKKQQAYEEFLKEKLMIDEIVRKIYEEDQRYTTGTECLVSYFIFMLRTKSLLLCAFRLRKEIILQSNSILLPALCLHPC